LDKLRVSFFEVSYTDPQEKEEEDENPVRAKAAFSSAESNLEQKKIINENS
jgi:hypothetical protein